MKTNFMPKALDSYSAPGICVDVLSGMLTTPLHFHDCAEIIHICRGSADINLGGETLHLEYGDSFIIPRETIHNCACNDAESLRLVIGFNEEIFFTPDENSNTSAFPILSKSGGEELLFRRDEHPEITRLMTEIINVKADGAAKVLTIRGLTTLVYALMYARWERDGLIPEEGSENATVAAIEEYLQTHAEDELSASEVAIKFNISYSYMAKLLLKHTAKSFSEHLAEARLLKSKRLLLSSRLSVTEIGNRSGFHDTSYFISTFRKATGLTPGKWRAKNSPSNR